MDNSLRLNAVRSLAVLFTVLLLISARGAKAGNTRSFFFGDEAALMGGAVVGDVRGSGALFYNPAGLGGELYNKLDLSGSAFMLRVRHIPNALTSVLEDENGNDQTHSTDLTDTAFLAVPTSLVWIFNLNKDLSLGLGVFVTQSEVMSMHNEFYGDLSDWEIEGESELNFAVETHDKSFKYKIGPALGWQITPSFRLGASLFAIYANEANKNELFSEVYWDDTDYGMMEEFQMEGIRQDWSVLGLQGVLGMQWDFTKNLHTGLTVRSPAFAFHQSYEIVYSSNYAWIEEEAGTSEADQEFEREKFSDTELVVFEPMEVSLGFSFNDGRWSLGLEGSIMPPHELLRTDT